MEKKNKIIVGILVSIIILCISLLILILTGVINVTKNSNNNINNNNNNIQKEDENKEEVKLLTQEEAIEISKKIYNDDIREFYNQYGFLGADSNAESKMFDQVMYIKSKYNSKNEVHTYINQYITDNAILDKSFYKTIGYTSIGQWLDNNYIEENGILYSSTGNKGSNMQLQKYSQEKSMFNVSNITEKSFDLRLDAYYVNDGAEDYILKIETNVIKDGNNWKFNSYKEIN